MNSKDKKTLPFVELLRFNLSQILLQYFVLVVLIFTIIRFVYEYSGYDGTLSIWSFVVGLIAFTAVYIYLTIGELNTLTTVNFPNEKLLDGEKLIHKTDSVYVWTKVKNLWTSNVRIGKTHLAITNKRIVFTTLGVKGDEFNFDLRSYWFKESELDSEKNYVESVKYAEMKPFELKISFSKYAMESVILSAEASELYEMLNKFVKN